MLIAPSTSAYRPAPKSGRLSSLPSAIKSNLDEVAIGAVITGGSAISGLALGAVTGQVLSHISGSQVFAHYGAGVGALGCAATALALSVDGEAGSLGVAGGAWAAGSALSVAGMLAGSQVGQHLVSAGASAYLGAYAPVVGAVAGGLAGAGFALIGDESRTGVTLKTSARGVAGAAAGLAAGGLAQAVASTASPSVQAFLQSAPIVAAAVGGAVALLLANKNS